MTHPTQHFVNSARNVCWLSGVIKRLDQTTVLICPSTDVTRAIQVNVRRGLVVPPDGSVIEASCHVYGVHSKETNSRSMRIEAVYFKRASIGALPPRLGLLQSFLDRQNPLASMAEIKEAVNRGIARSDAGIDVEAREALANAMVRETQKDRGHAATWQNKVIVTGFVGAKSMRQATDTDDAHLYLQLHQFPDTERALPIRIYGSVGSFSQHIRTLFPINVVGEIAFHDTPNAEGVLTRSFFVKVRKNDVGSASNIDFENRQLPAWWIKAFGAHRKQQEANRLASGGGPRVVQAEALRPAPAVDEEEIIPGM